MKKKGLFITFEGTEGAGKSSLIKALSLLLKKSKKPHLITREPGGPELCEKIRTLILEESMHPITEIFLYEASRAEHMFLTIQPALKKNKWVLCDRFTDSTLAYQSYARGLPWKKVKELNHFAIQGTEPDLKVFIDIDPAIGLKRAQDQNRFEKEGLHFQKKVRKGFLKSIQEDKKKWILIKPQSKTPDELALELYKILIKKINKNKWNKSYDRE